MRSSNSLAVLVLGVILGCAAEHVLVVPPARAGTSPQRWEYVCKDELGASRVAQMADQFGQEGWELVTAAAGMGPGAEVTWCFKRPLP
jgi:hypothetical protein